MIDPTRIQTLNDAPPDDRGRYVLYWMQASQRATFNHALEHAIDLANARSLPVVVCFGLTDDYPEANERHYAFMLEGLRDVSLDLNKRGIQFVVKRGSPPEVALHFAKQAALVVCDRGYLRHQKRWRDEVADRAACRVVEVESDVVVPVEVASDHAEFAARTIRPKIRRHWNDYLVPLRPRKVKTPSLKLKSAGDIDVTDPARALSKLKLDRSANPVGAFVGGHREARRRLRAFVRSKLAGYDDGRNEPAASHTTTLSPYLHFGNISPIEVALAVRGSKLGTRADREALLEELIVRRELAINFVHFTPNYDSYDALPAWAKRTLSEHANDARPVTYTLAQLERAETHDRWWNAAQNEMLRTGYMHNYMRMYWGKKILEWTRSPRRAYETTLYLNNKYFLDGRDPNGYANVAWIYGLHDRSWGPPRKIFGTVRYMNAAGLDRKFDMEAYARKWRKDGTTDYTDFTD